MTGKPSKGTRDVPSPAVRSGESMAAGVKNCFPAVPKYFGIDNMQPADNSSGLVSYRIPSRGALTFAIIFHPFEHLQSIIMKEGRPCSLITCQQT